MRSKKNIKVGNKKNYLLMFIFLFNIFILPETLSENKIEGNNTDIKILDKINEEVETVETEPDLAKLKKEIEILKQVVYEQGGGGEVRLEFLDDVDRDTALLGGRFLQYESSTKKFIGGDPVGAGSTWKVDSVGIHTTKNVGIGTSANLDLLLMY